MRIYLRTPLIGNEFKVCDELTDEVIAIFYNKKLAIDYVNLNNINAKTVTNGI